MNQLLKKVTALLCALFVLTGCVRVVNEVKPGGSGNMDIASGEGTGEGSAQSGGTEDAGTADGARADDGNTPARGSRTGDASADAQEAGTDAGDAAGEKVSLRLSEETYDEVKQIAANARFAVRNGEKWGVVDRAGREVYPAEYDFIETDGNGLFSLTKKEDSLFDARLMYYDAKNDNDKEVFNNDQYADYDFTAFYSPYITMTTRGNDRLNVLYAEAEYAGESDFEFFRLSKFDRYAITAAGMDDSRWEAASGFMKNMTSDGGSFISCTDWESDGTSYSNVVGIDGMNQIVLSEFERGRTIRMMPYAADENGNYAAYIVEMPSEKETPAYGKLNNVDFSAAGLTAFPSGTKEVIPDLSSGTERVGRSGRAVIANDDRDEAIFNMNTGKAETEFKYRSILLSGDNRYPSVAREDRKYVYITPDGETRDDGTEYTGASLYDEDMGYALVIDKEGNLYAIDRNGTCVSAKEEGFEDSTVTYLAGKDSHAFAVETDGKVRICVLGEE